MQDHLFVQDEADHVEEYHSTFHHQSSVCGGGEGGEGGGGGGDGGGDGGDGGGEGGGGGGMGKEIKS